MSQPQPENSKHSPSPIPQAHPLPKKVEVKKAEWLNKIPTEEWCRFEHLPPNLEWLKKKGELKNEYYHDGSSDKSMLGSWRCAGGSLRGRMHAHRGEYREDALFIDVGENHIMLCVADGAGSYEHSRIGSAIVCHELGNWLAPRIEKILNFSADDVDRVRHGVSQELVEGVRHVQTDLIEFAKSQKLDPSAKDFRCTLLVSILIKLPNGKLICISGQIGDGAIGYVTSKEFKILEHSASADFAGEVKCFFPDRNCVDVFTESMKKSSALPFVKDPVDLKMILLMTDGVADTFFPIQEQLQTIVSQLENGIASEAETAPDITYNRNHFPIKSVLKDAGELKKWLDFHKRGENDDRTLVVCWRND